MKLLKIVSAQVVLIGQDLLVYHALVIDIGAQQLKNVDALKVQPGKIMLVKFNVLLVKLLSMENVSVLQEVSGLDLDVYHVLVDKCGMV